MKLIVSCIKISICDDDSTSIEVLRQILAEYFHARKGIEARITAFSTTIDLIQSLDFDILFLDIFFADRKDGLRAIEQIRAAGINACVVFISSQRAYDISKAGFDQGILNYITKPFSSDDVYRVLDKALSIIHSRNHDGPKLIIKHAGGKVIIDCNDVFYIDTEARKRVIHCESGRFEISLTLMEVLSKLPKTMFAYTHGSIIVNLDKVDYYSKQDVFMVDGSKLNLSRAYKPVFEESLNAFVRGGRRKHG